MFDTNGLGKDASSSLINPASCNNNNALPPLVTSSGIATISPSFNSSRDLI